ncbi:MAG TPA: alpha/beta hydrolase-fold protein [Propionibacteriaceae bacterium]
MSLTGVPLLVLVAVLTLAAPVVATALRRRRVTPPGLPGAAAALGRWGSVVLCQALAVSLTFIAVNDDFTFYSSWGDLTGKATSTAAINTPNLVEPGDGRIELLDVSGARSGASGQVLVWLPPQYDESSYAHTDFPVVMVLPGQPSSPTVMFSHFDFAAQAMRAIDDHRAKPFVAVFPPLMTNPPRDTECTDVRGGPQAETWLTTDVRSAVLNQVRVSRAVAKWSVAGWSTGAFCAVKVMLRHPQLFTQAAGFGGYYEPITDNTTGNLFHGSKIAYDENSPLWLYGRTGGMRAGHRMLLISGRQDPESWSQTQKMLAATRGDPNVSSLSFPTGGHNYRNYQNAVPEVLAWLGRGGAFG